MQLLLRSCVNHRDKLVCVIFVLLFALFALEVLNSVLVSMWLYYLTIPFEIVCDVQDDTCRYKAEDKGATDTGFVDIPRYNESKLQEAVATVGPVSVAIDASQPSFQMYKNGKYWKYRRIEMSVLKATSLLGYNYNRLISFQ